jgi:hypothetical protein
MKFPVFHTKEQLSNSKWGKYFKHIYGSIPDTNYPININNFWMLYTDILDKYDIKLTDKCVKNNDCNSICPLNEGDLYINMSVSNDMKNTIWIYHKPPYRGFKNNQMVEVCHTSGGYTGEKIVESVGSWMYYCKGSGIYFNIGKTIIFNDHRESADYFLNKKISCEVLEECEEDFKKIFKIANKMGYDSIQYLKHDDMRCGNTAIEIVDLNGIGDYPCGNKTKLNIRSGWNGINKCICDNKKHSFNCKVNGKMIGGYDVYHDSFLHHLYDVLHDYNFKLLLSQFKNKTILFIKKYKYIIVIILLILILILKTTKFSFFNFRIF